MPKGIPKEKPESLRTNAQATGKKPISEGVRNDVELHGWAVDPNTGQRITKDDI